jgi:hypothetical protein
MIIDWNEVLRVREELILTFAAEMEEYLTEIEDDREEYLAWREANEDDEEPEPYCG